MAKRPPARKYEEIADQLRSRIISGVYAEGEALPLMRELAGQYGVSDITIRRAYDVLSREGLVDRRRRSGVFVKPHPDRVRLAVRTRRIERDELGYYSGPESQLWRALPYPDGERTRVAHAPVPADIAPALGVAAGEDATVRRRIIGDPAKESHRQLADSWIPTWVSKEIPALAGSTGLGGMYDRVEEWAQSPLHWREEVSARMPSPTEADLLLMPATGTPLLRVLRTTFLAEEFDRVVEVQDIRMSAAVFAVGYPLTRATSAVWPVTPATSDYYSAPKGSAPQ